MPDYDLKNIRHRGKQLNICNYQLCMSNKVIQYTRN